MGFEVYLFLFGETATTGLARSAVRSLFPVAESESELNYWKVRYDARNSCEIDAAPSKSNPDILEGLCVFRPCADLRLWEAMLCILRMGTVAMFWPGGPPVLADNASLVDLPKEMVDSLGPARQVSSGSELHRLVRE